MGIPYMAKALRGWTKKTNVTLVIQTVENHKTVSTTTPAILDCNFQPMPPARVNRKPEEQRTWTWWSIIVKNGQLLNIDDIIIKDLVNYKIESKTNWSESGFQKYDAIEDYQ